MRRCLGMLVVGIAIAAAPTSGHAQPQDAPKKAEDKLEQARLDDLIARALKNNPDIRVAESKVRETEAELSRTRMKAVSDITFLHAEIQAAKSMVEYAQKQYDRADQLYQKKAITAEEHRVSSLALEKAKADLAGKQAKLPYLLGQSAGNTATTLLDAIVAKTWLADAKDMKSTDEEFLRRLYLDLTGALPTVEELKAFLAAPAKDRREKWLNQLLKSHAESPRGTWKDWVKSCIRCHDSSLRPWSVMNEPWHNFGVDQPIRIPARTDSPLHDKLRMALDNRIKFKAEKKSPTEVLSFVRDYLPGVNLNVRIKPPLKGAFNPEDPARTVTADFSEPIPMGAFLQFLEDELQCTFILRDYGVVVISAAEKLPPGAVRVTDFWKHDKAADKKEKAEQGGKEEKLRNPPAKEIRGTIDADKADEKDTSLVSVSIGSDAGLQVGHTLEVYRLNPQAKFVGTIRIISVTPQRSIGRIISGMMGGFKAGDQVTSHLTPDNGGR